MKKLSLLLADLVIYYGALAAVLFVRYGTTQWQSQWLLHRTPFSLLLIVWLFSLYIANLYERSVMRNNRDFFQRLGQAVAIASIASVLFFYLIPSLGITPKTNLFLFLVIFALLLTGTRFLYNSVIAGGTKKRLLIVGLNAESLELANFIADNPQLGYTVRAMVKPIVEELSNIHKFIIENNIDTIVISPEAYQMNEVIGLFYGALSRHINFTSLASFTEQLTGRIPLGAINQAWFLDNMTEGSKRSSDVLKRGLDVIAAIILGIPTIAIMPLVALAIKIDSRGPVFIQQKRSGHAGVPFNIIKFRSMRSDAEQLTGAVWAIENDPRITRIGRILRKSRIDELPQLWNILKGDMSLVGPRAERPEFDTKLAPEIPFYRERYLIKPGLSGWAQINYSYGSSERDAMQKLQYDLYYIKHRSFILDLEIILKTINISLRRAGR